MNNDLISVIMSVYNEKEEWVEESIRSILNQTYKNIEFIIIIDNPENTKLIELIKKYEKMDRRVKFYINEKNMGLVYSLNRALKYCKGNFIARMDADDISDLNRLEKQLKYLKENNLDLIGSNVNLFNEEGIFYTTDKLLTHKYLKKLLYAGTIGIVHPTFFAKKEVFFKLKGYNNAFHAEDQEFLARVFCNGFKVANMKEVLLDCRYRKNSVTKSNAYLMYKTVKYLRNVFRKCIKTNSYKFNENYINNIKISNKEKENYNKMQILLGEARGELNNKNYIKFLYKIFKATFYSSAVFSSIRINLIFRFLKLMENIELRIKRT